MGASLCKTVPAGQSMAVREYNGEIRVVEGPAQICASSCCGREFEELAIVVAQENEYLKIKFRDGRSELRSGPTSEVVHPVEHVSINCESAIQLADQELIVVYRKDDETAQGAGGAAQAKRTIVRGPSLYIPSSQSEWIHEFCWTGPDPSSDSMERARKRVGALRFTKLRSIPAKMYFDVENVRTKDNALITVKLMIFYQLTNVDKMLDNTNDPMGDFVNAVSADVIEWCAPKKFDDFLEATDQLNTLKPYVQLLQSGQNMGYSIDRVVFRGYVAPQALQTMHDRAIERRTSLTLQKETEVEEQKMSDFKLQKDSERAAQEQQLAMDKLNHELAMKQKSADAERSLKSQEAALELDRLTNIRKLDRKGEMAAYLMAKDCQLPTVVNCATMMAPSQGNSGMPSLPGFR